MGRTIRPVSVSIHESLGITVLKALSKAMSSGHKICGPSRIREPELASRERRSRSGEEKDRHQQVSRPAKNEARGRCGDNFPSHGSLSRSKVKQNFTDGMPSVCDRFDSTVVAKRYCILETLSTGTSGSIIESCEIANVPVASKSIQEGHENYVAVSARAFSSPGHSNAKYEAPRGCLSTEMQRPPAKIVPQAARVCASPNTNKFVEEQVAGGESTDAHNIGSQSCDATENTSKSNQDEIRAESIGHTPATIEKNGLNKILALNPLSELEVNTDVNKGSTVSNNPSETDLEVEVNTCCVTRSQRDLTFPLKLGAQKCEKGIVLCESESGEFLGSADPNVVSETGTETEVNRVHVADVERNKKIILTSKAREPDSGESMSGSKSGECLGFVSKRARLNKDCGAISGTHVVLAVPEGSLNSPLQGDVGAKKIYKKKSKSLKVRNIKPNDPE